MKFREIEKILLKDGWVFKEAKGSHYQYVHPSKRGKVTVPHHRETLRPSSLNQFSGRLG